MVVSLVVAAIIQALLPAFRLLGNAPMPILLGVVIYYALSEDRSFMLKAAVLAGILQDGLCMIPLGYSSFVFVLIGTVCGKYRKIVFEQHWLTYALFGSLANAIGTIAMYLLLSATDLFEMPLRYLVLKVCGAWIAGIVVIPIVCRLTADLNRKVGSQQGARS